MIQAQEFRVGNTIKSINGRLPYWEVQPIDIPFLFANPEIYEPIPLTEKWLVKLGATKEILGDFIYDRFRMIWKESYKYWYVVDVLNNCYFTKIEFVHEWQNFVFVMNGKELTL